MKNLHLKYTNQLGLTIVELMVSVALSLLVVAFAGMALNVSTRGLQTSESSSKLTDVEMLINTVMTRAIMQAGYQPNDKVQFTREAYYNTFDQYPNPDVYGRTNSTLSNPSASISTSDIANFYAGGGAGGLSVTASPKYDLLSIRLQAVPESNKSEEGLTAITDLCTGNQLETNPYSLYSEADKQEKHKPVYTFYVADNQLFCKGSVASAVDSSSILNNVLIADGVLAFKVLYGVFDRSVSGALGAPTKWKTASDMSNDDWYYVKRIRIGILLQGSAAAGPVSDDEVIFYPLGEEFADTANEGTKIVASYADGKEYRLVNFTSNIENRLTPRNQI